jgi:hypothetical protein
MADGSWVKVSGRRCDNETCVTKFVASYKAWVVEHNVGRADAYATVLCEECRLRQLAQDWADNGIMPEFEALPANRGRGHAAGILLSREQYEAVARLALVLGTSLPDEPGSEPEAEAGEPKPAPSARTEAEQVVLQSVRKRQRKDKGQRE